MPSSRRAHTATRANVVRLVAVTTVAVLAASTSVYAGCPAGWVPAVAKPGSCMATTFDLNGGADSTGTWADARTICAGYGGDLYSPVSPDGSAEEAQIQGLLSAIRSAGAVAGGQTWMGVFRNPGPTGPFTPAWMTVDGSANDAGLNCGSLNCGLWVFNPANGGTDHPGTSGICARWVPSQTGIMSIGSCTQSWNALCEIKPDGDNDGVLDYFDLCPGTTRDAPIDPNGCARHQVDPDEDCVCNTLPLLDTGKFAKTKWCNVPGYKLPGESSYTPVLDICPDVANPSLPSASDPSKCQTKDGTGGVIPVDFTMMSATIMLMGGDVSATVYGPLQPNVCGSSMPSASTGSGASASDPAEEEEVDVAQPASEEEDQDPAPVVEEEKPEEPEYEASPVPVVEEEVKEDPSESPVAAEDPADSEDTGSETTGAAAPGSASASEESDSDMAAVAASSDSPAGSGASSASVSSSGIAMAAIGVAVAATALVAVGVAVAIRRRRLSAAASAEASSSAKSPKMPAAVTVDAGVLNSVAPESAQASSTSGSSSGKSSASGSSRSKSKSSKKGKHVRRADRKSVV